jgi:hypothetical protein
MYPLLLNFPAWYRKVTGIYQTYPRYYRDQIFKPEDMPEFHDFEIFKNASEKSIFKNTVS